MTTKQARKMALTNGCSFEFDRGYWTLDPRTDDGDQRVPLFFTSSSLRPMTSARFLRYIQLAIFQHDLV